MATSDLKKDHLFVRRFGEVIQRCSDKIYADKDSDILLEDLEIASVIMEELIDTFHHGKEEEVYFPSTHDKNSFSEDIRKFLIEHELGRRISRMFKRELLIRRKCINEGKQTGSKEPIARFLKSYAVFITDHLGKEDKFFDIVEDKGIISFDEDKMIRHHYELCKNKSGGQARIEELLKLLEYLEHRDWME
ncbi:MAG: hemerythrin domain-containing protein [Nitrososphaeraceae archaeon]|jgi:hemerythrin-like domain-containing protein